MEFSPQEKQRAIELAKKLGLEVSFDNEVSGVFVGDSNDPIFSFEDICQGTIIEHLELDIYVENVQENNVGESIDMSSFLNIFDGKILGVAA